LELDSEVFIAQILTTQSGKGVQIGYLTIEIRDEFDADEDEGITKVSDLEYLIDGSTNLDDINDRIGLSLSSEEYESIGGLIMEKLGRLPVEVK